MSPPDYECIHEDQIQKHGLDIVELQTEMIFKKEKIDKMQNTIDNIDSKLDKIIKRSEERDRDIELRLKAVEQTIMVIKYFIPVLITLIGAIGWKTIFG